MRHVVNWVKSHDLGLGLENVLARIVMLLFVLGSFLISCWFVRIFERTRRVHVKVFVILFPLLAGLSSAYMMTNPDKFEIVSADTNTFNAQFAFGGYPSEKKMVQLRREGYTGIISLLSPTLPPEKVLLEQEKVDAQRAGLTLYHLPMLPWLGSSSNEESLQRVRELAADRSGRYYVHCYLGMDRAGLVKRVVQESSENSKLIGTPPVDNLSLVRRISGGAICRLAEDLYFVPLPNQAEMIRYIIGSNVRQMISVLDPTDTIRGANEEQFIKSYRVPFESMPISMNPYDPTEMLKITSKVGAMPRPVVVYSYDIYSPRSQAFFQSFRSNLPSIPPGLFKNTLSSGRVVVSRTNVAIGPRPSAREWSGYLHRRGIREVVEVSEGKSVSLSAEVEKANLVYHHVNSVEEAYALASKGGPYYLTGPAMPLTSLANYQSASTTTRHRLDIGVYLFSTPTMADMNRYFNRTEVENVVFVAEEGDDLSKELDLLRSRKIPHKVYRFNRNQFDSELMLNASKQVWQMKKPAAVVHTKGMKYLEQGFIQSFTTGVPPAPPSLFVNEDEEVIGPNVVVAKTEMPRDLKEHYYKQGIRNFMYLGNPLSQEARKDRRLAYDAGLNWEAYRLDRREGFLKYLMKGGPWLIYGPGIDLSLRPIARKVEPAVPATVLDYPNDSLLSIQQLRAQLFAKKEIFFLDDFTDRYLPSKETVILISPILIIYTMLAASIVGYMRDVRGIRTSYTRKMFHFLIFTLAGFLQLSVNIPGLALFGVIVATGVLYGCLRGPGYPFYEALARDSDGEFKKSFVIIPLVLTGLGGLASYFFFGNFVVVGIFVVGFGDAVGEVVGSYFGKHYYMGLNIGGMGSTKTFEGSAAIAFASLFAAILGLGFLGVAPLTIVWLAPLIGVVAAVVEGLCTRAVDNFLVMVIASAMAYFLS